MRTERSAPSWDSCSGLRSECVAAHVVEHRRRGRSQVSRRLREPHAMTGRRSYWPDLAPAVLEAPGCHPWVGEAPAVSSPEVEVEVRSVGR
jgi:hypothetical protein